MLQIWTCRIKVVGSCAFFYNISYYIFLSARVFISESSRGSRLQPEMLRARRHNQQPGESILTLQSSWLGRQQRNDEPVLCQRVTRPSKVSKGGKIADGNTGDRFLCARAPRRQQPSDSIPRSYLFRDFIGSKRLIARSFSPKRASLWLRWPWKLDGTADNQVRAQYSRFLFICF